MSADRYLPEEPIGEELNERLDEDLLCLQESEEGDQWHEGVVVIEIDTCLLQLNLPRLSLDSVDEDGQDAGNARLVAMQVEEFLEALRLRILERVAILKALLCDAIAQVLQLDQLCDYFDHAAPVVLHLLEDVKSTIVDELGPFTSQV